MIDQTLVVQFIEQVGRQAVPDTLPAPLIEARKDGLPRAVAFRKISPRSAGVQNPKDAVHQRTGIIKRMADMSLMRSMGEERRDAFPLFGGKFVTTHGETSRSAGLFLF
jgi:hypothetical protein